MGETEPGQQVAAEPEAAPARAAIDTAIPSAGMLAGAATLARLGAGRAGGVELARQVLMLQRTAGNATTTRLLARQGKPDDGKIYRVVPPSGPASEVARWAVRHGPAVAGRDLIGVLTSSQLLIFTADPSPNLVEKAARGDAEHTNYWTGLWKFNAAGAYAWLESSGTPPKESWNWWIAGHGPPETLAAEADQARVKAMVPKEPGFLIVAIPEGEVTDDPDKTDDNVIEVTVTDDGSGWANEQTRKAKEAIDAARKNAEDDPYDDQPGDLPDRLVPWRRNDGKWFLNVWVGKPTKGGEALHVRPIEMRKKEPTADLVKRVRAAASDIGTSLDPASSTGVKGGAKGAPKFVGKPAPGEMPVPEGLTIDPTGGRTVNKEPFPARIVSHGQEGLGGNSQFEQTVTGATVRFTMDLDFAAGTSGFWEEFGNYWQVIAYRWELIDVSSLQLDQIKARLGGPTEAELRARIAQMKLTAKNDPDPVAAKKAQDQADALEKQLAAQNAEPDSGAARDIGRDLGNTWEDTKADVEDHAWMLLTGPVGASYFSLVAISDVVQVGGALLSAGVSELAAAMADRSVGFGRDGLFLLRCFAQPVVTQDDIDRITAKGLQPVIRGPSVAYLPVRVTPVDTRAEEVNDAELAQIKALEAQREQPPFPFTSDDIDARLKTAKAALADNSVEAIDRAIASANTELSRITQWRDAQGKVPLDQRDPALRIWEATLEMSGVQLDSYEKDLNESIKRLQEMKGRVGSWRVDKTQGRLFRPRITLVSELDGRTYPIVANLAEGKSSTPDDREWHLIDVTTDDSKHDYVGSGKTHGEAIRMAFQNFAENNQYGRGVIAIRLPDDPKLGTATDDEDLAVPGKMRSAPGVEERAFKRLRDLATAAEIAGLFISGPLGVGLMVAGGVAGGLVAIHNMERRAASDRLKLVDFETAMDIVAVAGAVLAVGGVVSKGVQTIAEAAEMTALARRGRQVAGAIHMMGIGMLAGQILIIPASTVVQLTKIADAEQKEEEAAAKAGNPGAVDHAKYRAQRLEAVLGAIKSIAVTARMVQLGADPSKGWDPFAEPVPKAPPLAPAGIKAAGAATGLPPDLSVRVPVEVDPALGDSRSVRVYYDVDPATQVIRAVRMRVGSGAGANDVALHVDTARALLRYSGLSGRVRVLWNQLVRLMGSTEPPAYSKAWEARLELQKFPAIINDRAAQLANPKLTPERRGALTEELGAFEEQVNEHARTVADMNIDPGRGYVAAETPTKPATKKAGGAASDPAATTTPKSKLKTTTPASGQPPPPIPAPTPGPPKTITGISDQRTAAMGGIDAMRQIINPFNEVETVIQGRLIPGMDRTTAPNYNRETVWGNLRKMHPELKLTDWEAAHLWGPGFGDEAAAGMMLAPKDVNQVWQNQKAETFLRDLRDMALQEGWVVHVRAAARSHPRTFAGGMGDSLMQSVQYDFSVARPGETPQPFGQISFSVGLPPGGVVSEPSVIMF